ncbi:MAG: glutamine--fructose-6-phosphate aminotransferase [Deltaproteobacteria bacterium]|nr:MAG: glutamine--fructose-6-phosphate aminotransferase [Deltaproteobacteria bacterium]
MIRPVHLDFKRAARVFPRFPEKWFNIGISILRYRIYLGRSITSVPRKAVIFFPLTGTRLSCGLTCLIAVKPEESPEVRLDIDGLKETLAQIESGSLARFPANDHSIEARHLGGAATLAGFWDDVRVLKQDRPFEKIYQNEEIQAALGDIVNRLEKLIEAEQQTLTTLQIRLTPTGVAQVSKNIERLKDIHWTLTTELAKNILRVKDLLANAPVPPGGTSIAIFRQINAVLNSIDRLEVRGRDSAGLSLLFHMTRSDFAGFEKSLAEKSLSRQLSDRIRADILVNGNIRIRHAQDPSGQAMTTLTLTYKVAAEIGSLGDNVRFLRHQIQTDRILQILISHPHCHHTVCAHTRWASVGAITEPNCHPVDNVVMTPDDQQGIIHVCLNGDIDNHLSLQQAFESNGYRIHPEITTDTKMIPLTIEKHLKAGHDIADAFRLAVNEFAGSHAISMHTDLAPGKIFLAQKGSGQAIFIGLARDHYMPVSEVYGFVEETDTYLKLDGEAVVDGKNGKTQGQIFILDQMSGGGLAGITAMYYDQTPVHLSEDDIKTTEITSRDIDRQDFPHYFLKEIHEAPRSVEQTLRARWTTDPDNSDRCLIALDETTFPARLQAAFEKKQIHRIFFIGQGTAGIAARTCADITNYYLNDPSIQIRALKASELSGFTIDEHDDAQSMADVLVVAISQSGTTTDTNRTVDMIKARGAHTLAIVNRRDSDLTFKTDGVIYTSSGRDIEMSVASTKAFYAQIVAGAILGLYLARLTGHRDGAFVSDQIKELRILPAHMRKVLATSDKIADTARDLATEKTYWATVGSGPNKASADEIRIKLSELCYKTISSDFVEDKKHIDLSAEPLIIVCAAGARPAVVGDLVKDTAIFRAHKAAPVVIADEGEDRFSPYAAHVLYVPRVSEHLAPILNTLTGHIWGYHAALAIHEGSRFIYRFREALRQDFRAYSRKGLDIYDIILEPAFREKVARFYREFRSRKINGKFPAILGLTVATDLSLLLKYLSGRLPVSDFKIDFGKEGSARNMIDTLFANLGKAINLLSRPVDAIKHQAKTVTVGTSRISDRTEGILFEALRHHGIEISRLINRNVIVLRNLQAIVQTIEGAILYRISGLNTLGELTDRTEIQVMKKEGALAPIPSRVETDSRLKGTKRIIVRQGNVYIGKGRKDDRSMIVIPLLSDVPGAGHTIGQLLLLNITFRKTVPLPDKIRALGGKYEHIKNIFQENSTGWKDSHLDMVAMDDLFGRSAEKIGELIVARICER